MVQQVIDVGTTASDGTGDPLRDAFTKVNDNFTELYDTVNNEGLTYGNIASNVAGITFNVTRYTESYAAAPVLKGTGQVVGNVYLIQGNVLGGTTPLNDVLLTVTTLANATVGNIATVSASGTPIAPVLRVNGLTGNVTLTVNNIDGAASKAYVNASISSNLANVTTTITNSLSANITAANTVISNHAARITTLESNSANQATQINNLVSVKANISYVDTSIDNALSSNAILANVASVNANIAAANAAILLRANLSGAAFTGNISANYITAANYVRTNSYLLGGSAINQGFTTFFSNPAALFFSNTFQSPQGNFFQLNLQNLDPYGSGDIVVTADDGNDYSNYITLGINGSQWSSNAFGIAYPHDGYVYVAGGNLGIQSATHSIGFTAGDGNTAPQIILTQSNVVELSSGTSIRFGDGTMQSTAFGGNANITSINANITAANAAITSLQANAAAQALDLDSLLSNAAGQGASINTLLSNAATQATQLDLINANIGSYQIFSNANAAAQAVTISSINANVTAANININTLLANAATQALELDNLQSNAQAQQGNIISLQSNASGQATQIDLLNANVLAANTNITTLTSNSATQATQINLLNANLTAANVNITNLQSNAASQQLELDNLQANVNFYLANVASSNANIAAANARIITIDANLGSTTTNVSTLQSNVSTLQSNISNLNSTKANLTGSIFSGNVQAEYLLANANVIALNGIFESIQASSNIDYPNLGSRFVGNVDSYYQVVLQNLSANNYASTELVITADNGNDSTNYLTIGINSSTYDQQWQDSVFTENPVDGFIECIGGNIAVRTLSNVFIAASNSLVILTRNDDLWLRTCNLKFQDGSILSNANVVYTSYTPANAANYNSTITNIKDALDELAARLRALGG